MPVPFAPTARLVLVESKVWMTLVQSETSQTWKVTLPVSCVSGSLKVAVSAGVAVFRRAASAGETRAGVVGVVFVVLFVMFELSDPFAAALPGVSAASRTIAPAPGCV